MLPPGQVAPRSQRVPRMAARCAERTAGVDVKPPLRIAAADVAFQLASVLPFDATAPMKSQRTNANLIDDLEVGRLVNFDH
jgi:hypothetical protein